MFCVAFCRQVHNVKGRVTSRMLELQATIIKQDLQELIDLRQQAGHWDSRVDTLPKIDLSWVQRWRKRHGVSWRCRTVCYKVSRAKLKARLGVLWRNCIRLLALHRHFFGAGRLRFRSYDQKPMWFCSTGGAKTLAMRGAQDVEIRENCHSARCRFTAMTKSVDKLPSETMADVRARSSGSGDPRSIAILFKAEEGSRVKAALDVPPGPPTTLVQTAPKGSYRVEQVVEFLKWDLGKPAVSDGSQSEVVMLDWFSAHLDPEVDRVIQARQRRTDSCCRSYRCRKP